MSYEIACARAKIFRGAAIYEGAQLSGCDGGNDPIALWQMVGLTDTTCPMSLAVRASVGSRQRNRGWDFGLVQFVRDASQDLLDFVSLHVGSARRVVVLFGLVSDRGRLRVCACCSCWHGGTWLHVPSCQNENCG